MKKSFISLLLTGLLCLNIAGCSGNKPIVKAGTEEKLELAIKYMADEKYDKAVLAYDDAIKIDNKEVKAYQGLARVYSLQKRYEKAQQTYERGITAVDDNDVTTLRLGLAGMYIDKGDLSMAEQSFQQIINADKNCTEAYQGLSIAYQQQGAADKAADALIKNTLENSKDSQAFAMLAVYYAESGNSTSSLDNIIRSLDIEVNQQAAYQAFDKLLQKNGEAVLVNIDQKAGSSIAGMLKFYANISQKKFVEASSTYDNQLKSDANNIKAQILYAICLGQTGNKNAASKMINGITGKGLNNALMADIAKYYYLAGDDKQAIKWANKALDVNEGNIIAYQLLNEVYRKNNPEQLKIMNTGFLVYSWQPAIIIIDSITKTPALNVYKPTLRDMQKSKESKELKASAKPIDRQNMIGELTITDVNGAVWKYHGSIQDGMANGKGTAIGTSNPVKGDKYAGYFLNNKRNGQGTMNYHDNSTYSGQWKDDKRNGKGTWLVPKAWKYVGQYKNDLEDGRGTLIWLEESHLAGNKYDGQFKFSAITGLGTMTWPDGRKYVGQWENGKPTGQGTVYRADGTIGTIEDIKSSF